MIASVRIFLVTLRMNRKINNPTAAIAIQIKSELSKKSTKPPLLDKTDPFLPRNPLDLCQIGIQYADNLEYPG